MPPRGFTLPVHALAYPRSAHAHVDQRRYGLATFGVAAGHAEALCGAALNSLVLLTVTFMTEAKMLRRGRRYEPN